jgi:ABC-type dipeptide/oligopeptide/nickel transport system ATPase component
LQEELNKTVVMVTHDITEAGKMADDIVLMYQGRIVQKGTIRNLLLRPADDNVREFLGNQGHGLALEALRLEEVLPHLPRVPPSADGLTLSPQTTLGQTLVALADVPDGTTVAIDGQTGQAHNAADLRGRILSDLREAEAWFKRNGGESA